MRMRHEPGHSAHTSSPGLGYSGAPRPAQAEQDEFGKGFDFRRTSGFTCNQVFEHEMEGVEYLANFSCCTECAEKAVACGYAVWSEKSYPRSLR